MKKIYLFIIILLLVILPIFRVHASKQNPNEVCVRDDGDTIANYPCVEKEYHLLAPITTSNGGTGDTFDPTQKNPLGAYLNLMITIVIGLAGVMSVMMIVIGGIEYMTSEASGGKESGRGKMTGAIMGLLIVIGAYALLYTINPDLLRTDFEISDAVIATESVDTPQGCTNGNCAGFTEGADWETVAGAIPSPFPPYVNTNHPGVDCKKVGQTNCTSLRGLQIGYVKNTQEGCGCVLTITGGTESWLHSKGTAHGPGSPVVDLATTPDLDRYIMKNQKTQTPVYGQRYDEGGISYRYEGNHWHVGG